ncbi:MAG: glycosyltransferase [Candidatus Aenigmarchaeota archaeon]|nr:glycosyltransferase [Candidatus Aenigmarchaeota archaeon]
MTEFLEEIQLSVKCDAMQTIDIIFIAVTGIVLYVSFLFLLLFMKNKNRMENIPKYTSLPSVTIIMPAYNEENVIAKAIANLKSLNYPKKLLEILVVNDNSTDKTAAYAESAGARVINNTKQGKPMQ